MTLTFGRSVRLALAAALALSAAALGVHAQPGWPVLYSNGPTPLTSSIAFGANGGNPIADSFVLDATGGDGFFYVAAMDLTVWTNPGDRLSSVDWAIYDGNPFGIGGATALAGGVAAINSSAPLPGTGLRASEVFFPINAGFDCGFDGCKMTLWIALSNGLTGFGGPVAWDVNSGLSQAYAQGVGPIPSESFQMLGLLGIPEPTTWALMLLGVCGIGATLRSRADGPRSKPAGAAAL